MRKFTLALTLLVTGCISTAGQLESQSDSRATVKSTENYQAVYQHILLRARECLDLGGTIAASNKINAQLNDELGTGEISYYLDNVVDMYFAVVKVKRTGGGAAVDISTGSQPGWANEKLLKQLKAWAEGGTTCQP